MYRVVCSTPECINIVERTKIYPVNRCFDCKRARQHSRDIPRVAARKHVREQIIAGTPLILPAKPKKRGTGYRSYTGKLYKDSGALSEFVKKTSK